jgi:hypothetical protein
LLGRIRLGDAGTTIWIDDADSVILWGNKSPRKGFS